MSNEITKPADWKTYDQFALGIATNRLPPTDALAGQTLVLALPEFRLTLRPRKQHTLDWHLAWQRGDNMRAVTLHQLNLYTELP